LSLNLLVIDELPNKLKSDNRHMTLHCVSLAQSRVNSQIKKKNKRNIVLLV